MFTQCIYIYIVIKCSAFSSSVYSIVSNFIILKTTPFSHACVCVCVCVCLHNTLNSNMGKREANMCLQYICTQRTQFIMLSIHVVTIH